MQTRRIRQTIRFRERFSLSGVGAPLPAGDYVIIEDEELMEGLSWIAYRRTGTFIEVSATQSKTHKHQVFTIDREELEYALNLHRAPSLADEQAHSSTSSR